MKIVTVTLKNFRCFEKVAFNCDSKLVVFTGHNGSGKSSVAEACHYAGYLKSFRTHSPREMIAEGEHAFAIALEIQNNEMNHTLHVGFSSDQRIIRLDERVLTSYQELLENYRIVTLHADDILLIQGAPEKRRIFLDQAMMLCDSAFAKTFYVYRHMLSQRNALLAENNSSKDQILVWTERLWQYSMLINTARQKLLNRLQQHIEDLVRLFFNDSLSVSLSYCAKKELTGSFQKFLATHPMLFEQELLWKRSCFGPHLDDMSISINLKKSRSMASRGQQKCVAFLLKIAFMKELEKIRGKSILLCDDFFSEFDTTYLQSLLHLLDNLDTQVLITTPELTGLAAQLIQKDKTLVINLPS